MRTEKKIKKLVGLIDGDYYVCDDIFSYSDGLHGATATVLRPVPKNEYEDRIDSENSDVLDYFQDAWAEQVKAGRTQSGLKEWVEMVLAVDGGEAVFDFSGYEYWDLIREAEPELTEESYPVFECVGGGRSFDVSMEWDKLYNKKLWQQIVKVEAQ